MRRCIPFLPPTPHPLTHPPHCSCHLAQAFKGKEQSTVQLAECGCIIATGSNGLGVRSLVDPSYMLDKRVADATTKKCPDYAKSPGCG